MTRKVVAEIMARWLTVLMALVAQGMALMSPVCFVRCVGADGHECVELVGQGCRCRGCLSNESSPQVCSVAKCCDQDRDHDEEHEAPIGPQVAAQGCSCLHSPLESAPQSLSRVLAADVLSQWQDVVLAPATLDCVADVRALDVASLQRTLSRPQESPQLAALATVVLRV